MNWATENPATAAPAAAAPTPVRAGRVESDDPFDFSPS